MRLEVTQNGRLMSETQFVKGPIYIGRHPQSQVFLPDRSVSRQHAVIFLTEDKQWKIKDLQSANQTHVNGKAIREAPLNAGDRIKVGDFDIGIDLEKDQQESSAVHLEDTHAPISQQPKIISRALDNQLAPAISIPAHRASDLHELLNNVARANNSARTLKAILDTLIDQFQAYRVWCSFSFDPDLLTEEAGGRNHLGETFVLKYESIKKLMEQACQKRQCLLLQQIRQHTAQTKEQSAIIAPILAQDRVYGKIYLDSKPGGAPFAISDLDYALLLSVSISVLLENV